MGLFAEADRHPFEPRITRRATGRRKTDGVWAEEVAAPDRHDQQPDASAKGTPVRKDVSIR
ncbi:MAG TPA: hypothetical protein VMV93_08015 [Chloroflexota bacterium]|nr:hypothetical protein [Chloroflexota bacterium]